MTDSTITVTLGGAPVALRVGSPGRALKLAKGLATDDAEEQETALGALLAYLWPDDTVAGFADLWPRYSLEDLHAAASHVAATVAGWYPTAEEVAARVATFPQPAGQ